MSDERLLVYGGLVIAAGMSLGYFPLGVVALGCIIVAAALLRAWHSGRNG